MKKNYCFLFTKKSHFILSALFLLFCCGFMAHAQSIDKLEQLANGALKNAMGPTGVCIGDDWVTGNVNAAKAHYACGLTIPYRMSVSGLVPGNIYQVTIGYDTKKSGKHAIDFLTAFDRPTGHMEIFGHPLADIDVLTGLLPAGTTFNDYPLPAPTANVYFVATDKWGPIDGFNQTVTDGWSYFRIYNGYAVGAGLEYIGTDPALTTTSDYLVVNFTVNPGQSRVVLAWGGNIACADLWGEGMSAEAIPGSPYHMFVNNCVNLSGCGNKEVQLATSAIQGPTSPVCEATGDELDCFGDTDGQIQVSWIEGAAPFDIELWLDPDIDVPGDETLVADDSNVTSPYTFNGFGAGSYIVRVIDANLLDSECYADITAPPYNPPVLSCENDEVEACPENLESDFNDWKASLGSYTGGTEPVVITYEVGGMVVLLENILPPDACGGVITIVTKAIDACMEEDEVSCTFTVPAPPPVVPDIPDDRTVEACLSQEEVDQAFADWLDEATASGGCNPQVTHGDVQAPDACGGFVMVGFTTMDECLLFPIMSYATFTVPAPPAIEYNIPENRTIDACLSQEEVDQAFADWLDEATASGGCNPQVTHGDLQAPDACGGTVMIGFSIMDECLEFPIINYASFTVLPAPPIESVLISDNTVGSCQIQYSINELYFIWHSQLSFSGGCGLVVNKNVPPTPDHCGGTATVTWEVTSDCEEPITGSATFTVEDAPPIESELITNETVSSCLSQHSINAHYFSWHSRLSFSGGCGLVVNKYVPPTPDHCGGSATVEWTVLSDCEEPIMGSATFTVEEAPPVEANLITSTSVGPCLSQAEVNQIYYQWREGYSFDGGCNLSVYYYADPAPDHCGGTATVTWEVTSDCEEPITGSATFTVEETPSVVAYCSNQLTEVPACAAPEEIDILFEEWKTGFGYSSGCEPVNTNQDELDALDWRVFFDAMTGGTVSFTYEAWDDCSIDISTCEFFVPQCVINCETAYGRLEEDGESLGTCFIGNGFDRWGWTNLLEEEGEYEMGLYAGAADCDITKGWGQAGTVHLTYGNGSLRVEYSMFPEYSLSEVHIYVGCAMYPVDKKGKSTVAPGQYTVNLTDFGMLSGVDYTLSDVYGPVYVIAHAVVCDVPWTVADVGHGANNLLDVDCPTPRSARIATSAELAGIAETSLKVYPNPFNERVTFEFVSAKDAHARIEITNILGQRVATLMDYQVKKGVLNRVEFEPVDMATGIFIYKLVLDDAVRAGRIIYKRE